MARAKMDWALLGLLATGVAIASVAGCEVIGGFQDFEGGGATTGSTTGATTSTTTARISAKDGCPGAGTRDGMVLARFDVPAATANACFFIDEYEVSAEDYSKFNGPSSWSDVDAKYCATKTSWQPKCADDGTPTSGKLPVVCVDWCDAAAYCISVGKRLCTRASGAATDNPASNEFYAACTTRGGEYPYEGSYDTAKCNGATSDTGCTKPGTCALWNVDEAGDCATDTGILNLVGNVKEWTNECTAQSCNTRGGSNRDDGPNVLACKGAAPLERTTSTPFIGFRCCADAPTK
jgi:formylglycine-generating enzyme required for sulfatase activity